MQLLPSELFATKEGTAEFLKKKQEVEKIRFRYLTTGMLLILAAATAHAGGEEALAKESQNPVANLISLPLENNLNFGVGPEDARVNTLSLKPVYPVQLGELLLINRFIVPLEYQEERFEGEGSQ